MMMDEDSDRLQLQHLAGQNIISYPPLFSPDGNFIFAIAGNVVQVFSSITGQPTRIFEGSLEPLISLELELHDNEILVGCTEAGEIIRWKWATGKVVRRVFLPLKSRYQTFNLLNYFVNRDSICAFVTFVNRGNPLQCSIFDTVSGGRVNCPLDLLLKRRSAKVDVDKGKFKYIAVVQENIMFLIDYRTWVWKKLTNHRNVPFTCVKLHPKELAVATGDELGKILLWRNFLGDNAFQTTLYHWHHTMVTSIAFTCSGTGLYSSGQEAVLVKWNITRPEQKRFVPRMTSIILHITSNQDNSLVAVSTADNGIQILDETYTIKCTLQEFTYIVEDKTETEKFPVGLRVNPRKNTLVLNGRVGHLQFFSTYTRTLLYNMDIVGANQLSMESEKILYNICVTRAAFNIDWMATAEIFNDEEHTPEVRLKFWQYEKENQSYALNTCVEFVHEGGVSGIEFSNTYYVENLLCATIGLDNIIKLWALDDSGNIYKKGKVWFCVGQTSYKNYPIESIGFSQDGSLLAAGFGNTLCVYDSKSLKLLTALAPSAAFDGCIHKVQVVVPHVKENGSKVSMSTKTQQIMQMVANLLHSNDEALLKKIKSSMKSMNVTKLSSIDYSVMQQLYKRIQSNNQMSVFQKILIYQKLGFSFQLPSEWRNKILEYYEENDLKAQVNVDLAQELRYLNLKSRFKAKYRVDKFTRRKPNKFIPIKSILQGGDPTPPNLTNGMKTHLVELETEESVIPPLQSIRSIHSVSFCFGDFAHLVVVCTENRVLIWNLLTLRLQNVFKLSANHIAIDSQTNLISVFTKKHELYVLLPSSGLPVYFRGNMPSIHGAVWVPKKYPKPQAVLVNWQSKSTLYFLTNSLEIMYLGANNESEEPTVAFAEDADTLTQQYSTFGAFAVNQINNTKTGRLPDRVGPIGVHGKAAVKSFLEMSCHTMAPLSLMCADFIRAVVDLNVPEKENPVKSSKTEEVISDSSDTEDNDTMHENHIDEQAKQKTTSKKLSITDAPLNEEHLQKVAQETIEIEFEI